MSHNAPDFARLLHLVHLSTTSFEKGAEWQNASGNPMNAVMCHEFMRKIPRGQRVFCGSSPISRGDRSLTASQARFTHMCFTHACDQSSLKALYRMRLTKFSGRNKAHKNQPPRDEGSAPPVGHEDDFVCFWQEHWGLVSKCLALLCHFAQRWVRTNHLRHHRKSDPLKYRSPRTVPLKEKAS